MMDVKKKTKTDEAWERLYSRFEQDNLLPQTEDPFSARRKTSPGFSVVAAAIVAGIVCCIAWWMMAEKNVPSRNFVTQLNEEIATLVKTLEDGTVVYLAQSSTLQYPEHFGAHEREVNLRGEAFFDVAKKADQTFLIDTEKVRVEVLGTAFDVRSNGDIPFSLSVKRGKVKVWLKQGGQVVYVATGETVTLEDNRLQRTATKQSGLFERYTRNMRFKDECLEDVLRVINRELPGEWQIEMVSSALSKKRLTVEFSNNSPESVADLLCWTFNLKCTRQGNKLILEPILP